MILKINKKYEPYLNNYLVAISPGISPVYSKSNEAEDFIEYDFPSIQKWTGDKTQADIELEIESLIEKNLQELIENTKKTKINDLQIAYKKADTIMLQNGINCTLEPNTYGYKDLIAKIKNAKGSIAQFASGITEKGLTCQNFIIKQEDKSHSINLCNYLWEYFLEEIIEILAIHNTEYQVYLEKINKATTLNELDFEVKFTMNDGIIFNINQAFEDILKSGLINEKPQAYTTTRYIKELSGCKLSEITIPLEIVEAVLKFTKPQDAFISLEDKLVKDQEAVQEMLSISYIK